MLDPQGGAVGGAAVEVVLRNSEDPSDPGYLRSSSFGKPVTTAGGVFGSGGPRAVQLGLRLEF